MRARPKRSRTTGKLIRAAATGLVGVLCCCNPDNPCLLPSVPFGEITVDLPALTYTAHTDFVISPHATVRPGSSGSADGSVTLTAGDVSMPAYYTPDPDGRGWTVFGSKYILASFSTTTEIASDGIVCARSGTILVRVEAYATCRSGGLKTAGAAVYTETGCPVCEAPPDLASATSSESTSYASWQTSSYSGIFGTNADSGSVSITTSDATLPYGLSWPSSSTTGPGFAPSSVGISWSTGTASDSTVVATCADGTTNTGTTTGCVCPGCLCTVDYFFASASRRSGDSVCTVSYDGSTSLPCDEAADVASSAIGWTAAPCLAGSDARQIWFKRMVRCAADAIGDPGHPPAGGCVKCGESAACASCVRYDFTAGDCSGDCDDCPIAVGFGEEADCPEGMVPPGSAYWTGWTNNGDGTYSGSIYVCADDDTGEAPYIPAGPGCMP